MARTKKTAVVERKDVAEELRGEYTVMGLRLRGNLLLVHQWGQKSVIEMLAKMTGHPVVQLNKDLTEEGDASAYRNERGQDVLPCRVVKACFVNGASQTRGAVKAHEFNRHVRVVGHTTPLKFESVDRCDVQPVKVGPWNDRVVDLRARTMYSDWSCDVVLRFPHAVIGREKVLAAVREAGNSVGLCEMRIEKGFELGGFVPEALPRDVSIDAVLKACDSPEKRFEIPASLLRAASAKIEQGMDKRNPKKKVNALVNGVNGAPERHAKDAATEATGDAE